MTIKIIYGLIIIINLILSVYLVFRVISGYYGVKISLRYGVPRKRCAKVFKCSVIVLLVTLVLIPLVFSDILLTGIISSACSFLVIVKSKILLDNSTYFRFRPSKSNDRLSSLLTPAMLFQVLFVLIFLEIF
jgi:hypothetical protein